MTPIVKASAPGASVAATATAPTAAEIAKAKRAKDVHDTAVGFEELLVKQLLTSANVVPNAKQGYGGMALDALASSITRAGGLGLAANLERELSRLANPHASAPAKLPGGKG